MHRRSCLTDNPSTNRFCDHCGAPLEARCPQCATLLRAGARFCGAWGHRLTPVATAEGRPPPTPATAPPPARHIAAYTPKHLADKVLKARSAIEGERRQVTVLFADIAGFTTLAEGRAIIPRWKAIAGSARRSRLRTNQLIGG
jgi:hypothetical protein